VAVPGGTFGSYQACKVDVDRCGSNGTPCRFDEDCFKPNSNPPFLSTKCGPNGCCVLP
jgi:hypothetical protein